MGGQSYRPGDVGALILDRLDTIAELLRVLIGATPGTDLLQAFPELAAAFSTGQAAPVQRDVTNKLLAYLLSAALPSSPETVRTITVGLIQTLLASNQSQPLMRVAVTNLNVAQPLLVSKEGVNVNTGQIILARSTTDFVLPAGTELYGIVALGTIQVTVSTGYDIEPLLVQMLQPQQQ
jgi:hypothetical protein